MTEREDLVTVVRVVRRLVIPEKGESLVALLRCFESQLEAKALPSNSLGREVDHGPKKGVVRASASKLWAWAHPLFGRPPEIRDAPENREQSGTGRNSVRKNEGGGEQKGCGDRRPSRRGGGTRLSLYSDRRSAGVAEGSGRREEGEPDDR